MTRKEKIRYLEQHHKLQLSIRGLERQIGSLEEQIIKLRESKMHPGYSIDAMPHGSKSGDGMSEYAAKIDELERQIGKAGRARLRKLEQCVKKKEEIEQNIARMKEPVFRNILWNRHIARMTWEQTADDIGYSESHARRLYTNAITAFEPEKKTS